MGTWRLVRSARLVTFGVKALSLLALPLTSATNGACGWCGWVVGRVLGFSLGSAVRAAAASAVTKTSRISSFNMSGSFPASKSLPHANVGMLG